MDGTVANISWNPPPDDERNNIDFYKVEVYASGSDQLLYTSRVKDTHEQVALELPTSQLVVIVTASSICGQLSQRNASTTFTLTGKRSYGVVSTLCLHVVCHF